MPADAQFTAWYEETLRQECARGNHVRESHWTEAAAVGEREWIEALASRLPNSWRTVEPVQSAPAPETMAKPAGTYALRLSGRRREGMLDLLRK